MTLPDEHSFCCNFCGWKKMLYLVGNFFIIYRIFQVKHQNTTMKKIIAININSSLPFVKYYEIFMLISLSSVH
jgi:hypothetical protein